MRGKGNSQECFLLLFGLMYLARILNRGLVVIDYT